MIAPYYQDEKVTIYHGDCREILPYLPKVDLVLTDPPYGIGRDGMRRSTSSHGGHKPYEFFGWDRQSPEPEIFDAIFAGSTNQIIWGANYFTYSLPPSMGWLVWDKGQRICGSDAELAYTSFDGALRVFTFNRVELLLDGAEHPTQKPLRLIAQCITHADKQVKPSLIRTIADPYIGAGTTLVAAARLGRQAYGIEIEERYCEIAARRIEAVNAQPGLFTPEQLATTQDTEPAQSGLFATVGE